MRAKGIVFTFLMIGSAFGNTPLVEEWLSEIESRNSGNLQKKNQAFCYIDDAGTVKGYNVDKPLGLASVSKILTSIWALKKLGANHTFPTKLYIKGKDVHIEGGQDPVFARRSLYNMINQLNKIGITQINTLSYDKKFYFVPQAIDNSSHAQVFDGNDGLHYCRPYAPRRITYKQLLESYMNVSKWKTTQIRISKSDEDSTGKKCINVLYSSIRSDYLKKRKTFRSFRARPDLSVKTVRFSSKNPFLKKGKIQRGTRVLNLKSLKLIEIIKYLNTVSANLPADLIFHSLGGEKKFRTEMDSLLSSIGYKNRKDFISGSGIPLKTNNGTTWTRTVNKMSCHTVLKILELLLRHTNDNKIPLFDEFDKPIDTMKDMISKPYLAVSGVEGTVRRRFSSDFPRNFVAKTGTLFDATTLAGTLNTTRGKKHFVFLNTYPVDSSSNDHIQISRNIQNKTIKKVFETEGPQRSFTYKKQESLTSSKFQTFVLDSEVRDY